PRRRDGRNRSGGTRVASGRPGRLHALALGPRRRSPASSGSGKCSTALVGAADRLVGSDPQPARTDRLDGSGRSVRRNGRLRVSGRRHGGWSVYVQHSPSRTRVPSWLVIVARSWQTGLSALSASTSTSAVSVSPR